MKPVGRPALWIEFGIIGACCFISGFGLALKTFPTARQRLLGGLFFTGSSLWLIFSVAFLGCMLPIILPAHHESLAEIRQQQIRQEAHMKAMVARQIAPRDAQADATMLDLSPYYDNFLIRFNRANTRINLPGTFTWNGVKFDVRAKIQLGSPPRQGVESIPVGRKCSELYFLHGVQSGSRNEIVSKFVIHLEGTNIETIPMTFGKDLAAEFVPYDHNLNTIPTNMIVWEEIISTNVPPRPLQEFFVSRWINSYPDQMVKTIDFESGSYNRGAFLVAITLKPILTP